MMASSRCVLRTSIPIIVPEIAAKLFYGRTSRNSSSAAPCAFRRLGLVNLLCVLVQPMGKWKLIK